MAKKENMNPRSLENLKGHGFKKGQSGNPLGAAVRNPALRALRKLTIATYREVIELALTGNIEELKKVAESPDSPAVQVGVAIALMKAIKAGDWNVIEQIAARIVGKIPDELKVTSDNQTQISVVNQLKIKEALDKLESDV